jgi:fructosamine-3-kinase
MIEKAVQRALGDALGESVVVDDLRRVSGGSINQAAVVSTSSGEFFVKWNRHPIPDQFDRESEGLTALVESGTSLRIPKPITWRRPQGDTPAFLVLEYLEPGARVSDFDERLGRGLAELHRATAAQFGFGHDNYCGATPQPNSWEDDWITFYREHRLRHQLELAARNRSVSRRDRRDYESLLDRLDTLLGIDPEPPALIHGDLWSGNLHVAPDGLPGLIDPAAYYGHREAELGMMSLFGGFSQRVYDAYDEAYSLQPGWRERLPLYELYHVMNHYNLFGGHYASQAFAIVRRFC